MLDPSASFTPETTREPVPWWATDRARTVALNLVVAASYWLLAELTLVPTTAGGRVMPMWPPAGVAVAAMILGGRRLLPGVALGSFLTISLRAPVPAALLVSVGVLIAAIIDVQLLRRLKFNERLERVRDPLILSGVAMVGAAADATFRTIAIYLAGALPAEDLIYGWGLWWMRDWLGVQITAALILTWARSRAMMWTRPRVVEAVALTIGALLICQVLFGVWVILPSEDVSLKFLFFPIAGYAGLRFGPQGASTFVAIIAAFAIPIAAQGVGPFGALSIGTTHVLLHVFLLFVSLSALTLAAMMAEREDALQRRLALEEELRHSQKMEAVGRLAGGIAHDFNNLLTAIIGYTELVMMGCEQTDPRRADADEIARAAMRAADLTRQMLAFSRKQILQPKVIDLNLTLGEIEPMLRRVIGEDILMTISPKATQGSVHVDPGQIEQVLMNLVVNARDAMPRGGRLTVETGDLVLDATTLPPDARPGPYVMLAVTDTGIGMSADVRARIFEPYFTTKDVGKGTGLGLSTAYGIIRQSEGHIQVSSEPGLGTTFRIYLPKSESHPETLADIGEENMPRGAEHVLLIEDDPSVRRLSKELLVRLGYSVTEAASGRAGLALGSDDTRHFDLALCDVILGDMSGPAVYEALRALRPSVRVLYMSGYADEAIVRTGVLDEGYAFLQKPFTPRDFAIRVRNVLDAEEEN